MHATSAVVCVGEVSFRLSQPFRKNFSTFAIWALPFDEKVVRKGYHKVNFVMKGVNNATELASRARRRTHALTHRRRRIQTQSRAPPTRPSEEREPSFPSTRG